VLDFGFNIPLYGDHFSLFCFLMFGMQFFYTWYTMRNQNMGAGMPGMKFVMYFMPFMMLFIFNSQSAGLNLYYLISLTFTMVTMMLIRRFTSERKVRARMAAYDQKHANDKGKKKKGSFQRRFEEMQKMAEQMQKNKK
jgi:YidC/Oxa1 family membrane protein insertase